MESDESRLIELRQLRAISERNNLQPAIAQVKRQHNLANKNLQQTRSKFRTILEKLKSQLPSGQSGPGNKLDDLRFSANQMRSVNGKLAALTKSVSILGQRHLALSQKAAKLDKINIRCQERAQQIKRNTRNQRDISFEEEHVEVETYRRRSEDDAQLGFGNESMQASGMPASLNVQADGRNSNNHASKEFVQAKETTQTPAASNQISPFENIERIQAWRVGQLASVVLTYRLTSGRAINIEASQVAGAKIQISLAPEFQRDRDKLLREKARMVAALRVIGVKVEEVVIL